MREPAVLDDLLITPSFRPDRAQRLARRCYNVLADKVEGWDPSLADRMRRCGLYDDVFAKYTPGVLSQRRKTFRCGERHCPYCGLFNSWRYARAALEHISRDGLDDARVSFFTATHQGVPWEPLAEAVSRFNKAVKKFQTRLARRKGIAGRRTKGAGFIEICRDKGCWHVHIHYLLTDVRLSHAEMKALWRDCEGGRSHVKDLPHGKKTDRFDDSVEGHAKRVTRYIAKGCQVSTFIDDEEMELLNEVIRTTRGKLKFFRCFGAAKGTDKNPAVCDDEHTEMDPATEAEFVQWLNSRWTYLGDMPKEHVEAEDTEPADIEVWRGAWLANTSIRRSPPPSAGHEASRQLKWLMSQFAWSACDGDPDTS